VDSARTDSGAVHKEKSHGTSPLKLLMTGLSPIRKALTLIDPITLSWDNTASHSQSGTSGQAKLNYQFGFTQNPGIGLDTTGGASYTTAPIKRTGTDITARSGLRITRDIKATFNHAYRTSENIQVGASASSSTGQTEQTTFWLGKSAGDLKAYPFVDVSLDWGGLERYAYIEKVAQTVSLTSGLANKERSNWTGSSSNVQTKEYTRQWNPLLGVNFSWKGGIDSQIRYNTSQTFTNGVALGNRSRASDGQLTGTVSYSLKTGFRVPLLFMRAINLQNQTTFSLSLDYRTSKQEATHEANSDAYSTTAATSSWSVSPRITYTFSNTVQGQAYVQIQQTTNDVTNSKSRLFEFGVQVNIAIRG
jgi:hypothetical protein